jgi:hypothetical protein
VTDDDYEASYMKGAGNVLLRDKTVSRKFVALLGFFALWCGIPAIGAFLGLIPKAGIGTALFLTVMSAFFAFLATTLTVIRVVVSEGRVHVQHGLWGPRVPIERVRGARVVKYDWKEFGGWGLRRSGDGTWAYVMTGGDVVEMKYADEQGDEKRVLFSATNPSAVVASIEEARARAGVRIAADVRVAEEESAVGTEESASVREIRK